MKAERRLQRKQEKLNPSAEITDEMLLAEAQLGDGDLDDQDPDAAEGAVPGADDGV